MAVMDIEVQTLGFLHDLIRIPANCRGGDKISIEVDAARLDSELTPIYYYNFRNLIHDVLSRNNLQLAQIDHFIYPNISAADQEGFVRALGVPRDKMMNKENLASRGHTFANDLVINYTDLRLKVKIQPGDWLLFASAGAGFTWGVTLARAI